MKLKEYIKSLKNLEKQYGEAELIYSIDEEGNGFDYVYFSPSVKYISKEVKERNDSIDCMELGDYESKEKNVAVICIN